MVKLVALPVWGFERQDEPAVVGENERKSPVLRNRATKDVLFSTIDVNIVDTMLGQIRDRLRRAYLHELNQRIEHPPEHIAIIQDGNRRYAREHGIDTPDGHAHGANTTEDVLHWCQDVGIKEVTLYAFSTENFNRPDEELAELFDLITQKLYEFADADLVHDEHINIRGLGDLEQLPQQVLDAVQYAEEQTAAYSNLQLNVALAYGGRNELLKTAQELASKVAAGTMSADEITVDKVEQRLYREPIRDVDLVIRTGGDERTSNFLPWYANGNEAAVYFCTPYWPEFGKAEFLRAIRTYEAREESWQEDRIDRTISLINALAVTEYEEYEDTIKRLYRRVRDDDRVSEPDALDSQLADADTHLPDSEFSHGD